MKDISSQDERYQEEVRGGGGVGGGRTICHIPLILAKVLLHISQSQKLSWPLEETMVGLEFSEQREVQCICVPMCTWFSVFYSLQKRKSIRQAKNFDMDAVSREIHGFISTKRILFFSLVNELQSSGLVNYC